MSMRNGYALDSLINLNDHVEVARYRLNPCIQIGSGMTADILETIMQSVMSRAQDKSLLSPGLNQPPPVVVSITTLNYYAAKPTGQANARRRKPAAPSGDNT